MAVDSLARALAMSNSGGGSGTSDYTQLSNKPKINNVELTGNKTTSDLGITVPTKTSDLTNDSGFITNSYHDSSKQDTLDSTSANANVIAPLYVDTGELRISLGNGVHKTSDDALEVEIKTDGGILMDANGIYADTTVVQPKLTAGTNITIDTNNVISASGGTSLEGIANGGTYSTNSITIGTNNTLNGSSGSNAENSLVVGSNNYIHNSNCLSAGKYLTNYSDSTITFGNGGGKFYDLSGIYAQGPSSVAGGYVGTTYPYGTRIKAGGNSSIAIGYAHNSSSTIEATAYASRALGYADGGYIKANGPGSIAMGYAESSNGQIFASNSSGAKGSFAGGHADNANIHSEGAGGIAYGYADSTMGYMMTNGKGANAFGWSTIAASDAQTAIGKCNVRDDNSTYALIIGNGTGSAARSNALTVDWSGNITCNNIPAPPSTDGTYQLTCTVSSGVATYSWVSA